MAAWRFPTDDNPDSYTYDLESMAWAAVGCRVWPSLTRRAPSGYRHVGGVTYLRQIEGLRAFFALMGCLDAQVEAP